mmetsp:Transcript_79984/g.226306  ORF Transcript_79984/g.226306 Transcript_79984/m.226306 type:complete len:348 (-) Transcript_79984:50-1093(-)
MALPRLSDCGSPPCGRMVASPDMGTLDEPSCLPNRILGMLACVASAVLFAGAALLVKVSSSGFSMLQILWARGLLQLGLVALLLLWRRTAPWGGPELRPWLLLRGVLGVLSIFCYFLGVVLLAAGDTVAIFGAKSVLAALLAAVFLKEPLQFVHAATSLLTLGGCFLIAWTRRGEPPHVVPMHLPRPIAACIVCLGAALAAGVDVVLRRIMARSRLRAEVPVFYFCAVDVVLLAVATPALGGSALSRAPGHRSPWLWAALAGVALLSVLGQQAMTLGFRHAPVALGSVLMQVEAVVAFALQALVYGAIELQSLAGAALIAVAACLLAAFEMRRKATGSDSESSSPTD